jgi:hypothetical protein
LELAAVNLIRLGALKDKRLRVVEAIQVTYRRNAHGKVLAEAILIDEFGFGDSESEALSDLQHALGELYWELYEKRDSLGADLLRVWGLLDKKIRRVECLNA